MSTLQPNSEEELNKDAITIIRGITGFASDVKINSLKMASGLMQASVQGKFLDELKLEWDELVKRGKLNTGFIDSNAGRLSTLELLKLLESDELDEVRFQAVKNAYIHSAELLEDEKLAIANLKMMRLAATLNSDEILVLRAASKYDDLPADEKPNSTSTYQFWDNFVQEETGLAYLHWLRAAAKSLLDLQVLERPSIIEAHRLSKFGRAFTEFIS